MSCSGSYLTVIICTIISIYFVTFKNNIVCCFLWLWSGQIELNIKKVVQAAQKNCQVILKLDLNT